MSLRPYYIATPYGSRWAVIMRSSVDGTMLTVYATSMPRTLAVSLARSLNIG